MGIGDNNPVSKYQTAKTEAINTRVEADWQEHLSELAESKAVVIDRHGELVRVKGTNRWFDDKESLANYSAAIRNLFRGPAEKEYGTNYDAENIPAKTTDEYITATQKLVGERNGFLKNADSFKSMAISCMEEQIRPQREKVAGVTKPLSEEELELDRFKFRIPYEDILKPDRDALNDHARTNALIKGFREASGKELLFDKDGYITHVKDEKGTWLEFHQDIPERKALSEARAKPYWDALETNPPPLLNATPGTDDPDKVVTWYFKQREEIMAEGQKYAKEEETLWKEIISESEKLVKRQRGGEKGPLTPKQLNNDPAFQYPEMPKPEPTPINPFATPPTQEKQSSILPKPDNLQFAYSEAEPTGKSNLPIGLKGNNTPFIG